MAERTGMAALIDLTARLVNDPSHEAHSREAVSYTHLTLPTNREV